MRLETLIYIKKQLEHECEVTKATYEMLTKKIREKEDALNLSMWDETDDENLKCLRQLKVKTNEKWRDAENALEDFMSQRWGTAV